MNGRATRFLLQLEREKMAVVNSQFDQKKSRKPRMFHVTSSGQMFSSKASLNHDELSNKITSLQTPSSSRTARIEERKKSSANVIEKMEKKYDNDEYFLNQTIKRERKENDKVEKQVTREEMTGFFKLSDAVNEKKEVPYLMSYALDNSDKPVKEKIREFLGTDYKTDFFDNLDDFVGCIKVLYGNSRIISSKLDRAVSYSGIQDQNNIESLQLKFARDIRNKSLKSIEDKNKKSTIELLDSPSLQNLQEKQYQLGDNNRYSRSQQRNKQIGEMYSNSKKNFESTQEEMMNKEFDLHNKCQQLTLLNQKMDDYKSIFKENMRTQSIVHNLKSHPQEKGYKESKGVATTSSNKEQEAQKEVRQIRTKKEKQELFKKTIWRVIFKLKQYKLSFEDIFSDNVFPSYPYQRDRSLSFFKAVKSNDVLLVEQYLRACKFHIFDFDSTRQTALHWAARRNHIDMITVLCEYGADLETQDMGGRTPLFLCIQGGFMNSARLLMARGANPFVRSLSKKKASDYTHDEVVKALLRKSEQLHTMMELIPMKKRKDFWIQNAVPAFQQFSSGGSDKLNTYLLRLRMEDIQIT